MYNRNTIIAIFQIAAQRPWIGLAFAAALTTFAMFCATISAPAMVLLTKATYMTAIAVFAATSIGVTTRLIRRTRKWIRQRTLTAAHKRRERAYYSQHNSKQQGRQTANPFSQSKSTQNNRKQPQEKLRPEPPPDKKTRPESTPTKPKESPLAKHFRTLELQPGASMQAVKQAYHDLMKVWHPDRYLNDPRLYKRAEEKTKEINVAYHEIEKHNR